VFDVFFSVVFAHDRFKALAVAASRG
jgi:hypothetical protein